MVGISSQMLDLELYYDNAWIINQANFKLCFFGGGNIHRDLELDNMC